MSRHLLALLLTRVPADINRCGTSPTWPVVCSIRPQTTFRTAVLLLRPVVASPCSSSRLHSRLAGRSLVYDSEMSVDAV